MLDLLEERRCGYILGLSTNARLAQMARPFSEDAATRLALAKKEKVRRFHQTTYQAGSWSKARKIIARAEATGMGSDVRFVVTNLPGSAKVLYEKVYCARGRMENMIKDMKLYTRSDRTSCHRWEANQFRLILHMARLLAAARVEGRCAQALWRTATFETLRRAFLKIAVRVEELRSRIKVAFPSAYPHAPVLALLAGSVTVRSP